MSRLLLIIWSGLDLLRSAENFQIQVGLLRIKKTYISIKISYTYILLLFQLFSLLILMVAEMTILIKNEEIRIYRETYIKASKIHINKLIKS